MDANAIIQAIGSVGFPIVACCALFYLYDKTITKLTATLDKMDKTLDKMFERLDSVERALFVKEDDGK
jgi:hypothetical protein